MSITPLPHTAAMCQRCDWMAAVADRSIFQLTLPGTHHSATNSIYRASWSTAICRRNAQCQSLSILEQLLAGVRSLDVRVRLGSDGVIRASHSMRVSASLRLEHLFQSLEEILKQLMDFLNDNRTEVAVLILDTDCDPSDWPAMPGDCWQRVYSMLQPLLPRMLPYDQRFQSIGAITGSGCNVCVVCGKLRDAHGDPFWPPSVLLGSWGETYTPARSRFARKHTPALRHILRRFLTDTASAATRTIGAAFTRACRRGLSSARTPSTRESFGICSVKSRKWCQRF